MSLPWQGNRKLRFEDFKKKSGNDTTGYWALWKDSTGVLQDTVVANYYADTNLLFRAIPDTFSHGMVALNPYYEITEEEIIYDNPPLFYPGLSYMSIRTPDILCHEQIHFDIFEVFARKFRKYLETGNHSGSAKVINKYANALTDSILLMNRQYDLDAKIDFFQTGNLNKSDSAWNRKINARLIQLSVFDDPLGGVPKKKRK